MDDVVRLLAEALDAYDPSSLPLLPVRNAREPVASWLSFEHPRPLSELVTELVAQLRDGACHAAHPRHFGLFNPTTTLASVVADALVARFNPQCAVTAAAPFAVAVERHTLAALAARLGFDPAKLAMSFTTGGAEANHSAVLCALTQHIEGWAEDGIPREARPVVYASEEAHGSIQKAVRATGLGRQGLRRVAVDRAYRLDLRALRRALAEDRTAGRRPVMLVATAGTTNTGAIDPLPALVDLAREEQLWLHVDAAWGGIAALSPRTAHLLEGIAHADSVTWDAHKSLPVALGAGMFFCRHRDVVKRAFAVDAPYVMRALDDDDPFLTTMQWSRRFTGLKVALVLASRGFDGVAEDIDRQFALGDRLRAGLRAAGFEVLHDTALPVVCFTHPRIRSGAVATRKLTHALWRRGDAWISHTRLGGRIPALRACVTNIDSRADDIDALVAALHTAVVAP